MSGQSLSPGARSDPGRGDQTEQPAAEPLQRRDRMAAHQEQPQPQRSDRAAVHQAEPSTQQQPQRPDRRVASHQEPPSATKTVTGPPED